jgi:anti-repressor protein|nr:MAG TPA: KilAC domain protein [Caudoviricetes sp.]
MNELIKINYDTEQPTVSARELHEKLNIETPFKKWIDRMCEYGFEDGKDFWTKMSESTGGRPSTEYDLTIDMAKQICMIQRTPEGRECRQYFIDLEKAWNTPEIIMARGLKAAHKMIADQDKIIERMRPKEIFADAVAASKQSILIGQLAKLICQNGHEIGQKRLFKWMRENGYLMKSGSDYNMPMQRYVEQGLFEIKESSIANPDGSTRLTRTTKVTGKGQQYFINKFLGC